MSAPTTSSFWNQTTPAPAAGMSAAVIQSDNATPQDSRTVSVPNTGGVLTKTANYTAGAGDCGQLVSFNSGSAVAYTLPATPPVVAVSRWQVAVENIGAGALTISATAAAKLDGVTAGTLVLAQNTGCKLYTDGTDYFTERGVGSDISGLASKIGVQQESYTAANDSGAANAYVVTLSPVPTIVAYSEVTFIAAHANTGASTLSVNGSTAAAIHKNGSVPLLSGDIVAGQIVTCRNDGTYWQMTSAVTSASAQTAAFVQGNTSWTTPGVGPGVATCAFPAANTAHNCIVVLVTYSLSFSTATFSLTDSNGNTYTPYNVDSSNPFGSAVFVAPNIAGGANTITATVTPSGGAAVDQMSIQILEYSGVDLTAPVDAHNFVNVDDGTGSTIATATVTTTTPGSTLIMGFAVHRANDSTIFTFTPSLSSTGRLFINGAHSGIYVSASEMFDTVLGAAGAYSSNCFLGSGHSGVGYLGSLIALKAGVIAAGGTVISVGLSMPSDFAVSGSPVTGAGTLAVTGGVTKSGVQQEAYTYSADTGSANAYAVTLSPAPTLVAGSEVCFKAVNANTGASTLAVNGGTATAIKKNGNSTALASGDIAAGQIVTAKYDGTVWQILVPGSGGGSVALQTNGTTNGSQSTLNLAAGSNVTLTDNGSGTVTIAASGGGATVPTQASTGFTTAWAQAGTFSATDTSKGITLADTVSAAGLHPEGIVKAYPGTPFTAIAQFSVPFGAATGNSISLVALTSLVGKCMRFGTRYSTPWDLRAEALNTPTSFNSGLVTASAANYPAIWLKYKDDGTTITVSYSSDGAYFQQLYTISRASSFLGSSGFVYFGISIDPESSAHGSTLLSYTETSP